MILNTARQNSATYHGPRGNVFAWLLRANAVWRQRQRLAALDEHLLSDIGVTRDEILEETSRPVWDAPHFWRN